MAIYLREYFQLFSLYFAVSAHFQISLPNSRSALSPSRLALRRTTPSPPPLPLTNHVASAVHPSLQNHAVSLDSLPPNSRFANHAIASDEQRLALYHADAASASKVLCSRRPTNHAAAALYHAATASEASRKAVKLKELLKKRKGWKKRSWPQRTDDAQLLFALMDAKLCSMVLKMEGIVKGQLF
ncbi:hypothetical protein NL676_000603 [Syzygium grande]|nr:hypothetical protein NL676_000603 [Syzygium grande]